MERVQVEQTKKGHDRNKKKQKKNHVVDKTIPQHS
jgi:hypothetical protein